MLTPVYISHQLPNRTRLHIPIKNKDQDYFLFLKEKLGRSDLIKSIEINPNTSSVLIHHRGDFDKIAQYAKSTGLFELATTTDAEKLISELPNREQLMGIVMAGLGLYQISQRKVLPPALPLLINAFYMLRKPGNGLNRF